MLFPMCANSGCSALGVVRLRYEGALGYGDGSRYLWCETDARKLLAQGWVKAEEKR